jgi:hypothetical protein
MNSAASLFVLMALLAACERRPDESSYEAAPATVPAPTVTPSSSITELYLHLDAAHENFAKRDLERAGNELLAAASGLKKAAEDAPTEARQDMLDAASGLESIERDARSGTATSIESLDHHLARANAALAHYHQLRATDAWVARNGRAAGRELVRAVDQWEMGSRRMGRDLTGDAEAFSDRARSVGEKLANGTRLSENEVGQVLKGVGREIDKLATKARAAL